ncbi:putative metabolite transport protein [Fulvia fulva]|uniref:Metabolite transport protein n=1 Tax=Passalora fulva TaxID=5499 RepID=A0A9Q8L7Q9_PASFU|nr:putative metabolite transport protein [Fulvia fulva]KAK4634349.1 putative metabolite transport protein [Fulvia fulva]KAK4637625.1 putative metabolite transport protein [Fulvia fulva]UJO12412.1 putative metabolite transport protein [Fulvia fulva]WPV09491.1 putative metabolite transport protein [Fulvia fulva]WPV25274.1 putative metabolite transport protein [Fulvia fulva]
MAINPFGELTPYFVYLLLTATLGPLLFGYHLAELNAPQEVITCAKKSIDASTFARVKSILAAKTTASTGTLPQCIPMSPVEFGLVSSFLTLGGLIGALSAGPVTAKQGRLRAMIYSSIFAAIGPIFEAAAPNITVLTIGRFISGVGAGAATVVVPIYISEISPPHKRGFFGAFTQILTNCGILITQALGLFLSRGQLWRIILAVGGAIAVVQAVGLVLGGQESPKWLAENGQPSKGKSILKKIRGDGPDIEDEMSSWNISAGHQVDGEEERLLGQPTNTNLNSSLGVFGVLQHPDTRPAVIAVVMIMVGQQFTGINSIVMYGVGLLSDLLAANSAYLNVIVAGVNVIITTSCAPLSDRWGRKTCLLISISGMGISSILLAIGIMQSIKILSAISVVLFVASFGFGLGPIPFILAAELVNTEAVGATQSWALAANWIATFIVAQFFPLLNEKMGKGQVYFIFAAAAVVFGAFIAWRVPETRGRRDADEVWGRKKAPDLED